MGKIVSFIFGLILVGAGAFLIFANLDNKIEAPINKVPEDNTVDTRPNFDAPRVFVAQVLGEIQTSTTTAGIIKTPELLLQIYPNLSASDFANVEASGGYYTVADGEAVFIPNSKTSEKIPGAKEISDHGMETLLINIISRTGRIIDSQDNLTELFRFLKDTQEEVKLSMSVEVTSPVLNELVKSPLTISGKAKDFYQDNKFDVAIYDDKNNLLATSTAQANAEVNKGEFISFTSTIKFDPKTAILGKIVFSPRVDETSAPITPFEMQVRFR